jgi:hypothetical protein
MPAPLVRDSRIDVTLAGAGKQMFKVRNARLTGGGRDDLSMVAAEKAALAWHEITRRCPRGIFLIHFLGYDDDPRELWEFEEVRKYVCHWAEHARLTDLEAANRWVGDCKGRLDPPLLLEHAPHLNGVGFLAGCGVFGEEIRQISLRGVRATREN